MYMCVYIYIYIYMYISMWLPCGKRKRELECRIPRSHSPVNSRRFPETFGDFCKNKTGFL